jgi:hypothetical protein
MFINLTVTSLELMYIYMYCLMMAWLCIEIKRSQVSCMIVVFDRRC